LLAVATTAYAAGVVGSGDPGSCTDAALDTALAGGGLVTFNCGGPATIDVNGGTGTKTIAGDTTIDGGGLVTTISGGANPIDAFVVNGGVKFTVENLTIANSARGIVNLGGSLTVAHSTFTRNDAGIYGDASYLDNDGVYRIGDGMVVSDSTFTANSRSAILNVNGR
jgi:hypothetical protein